MKARAPRAPRNVVAAFKDDDVDDGFDFGFDVAVAAPGVVQAARKVDAPPPPKKHHSGRFQPGQSGNPQGGRLHDPELKAVRNLTKKELADIGNLIVKNDVTTLRELAESETTSVLKRMVASVCFRVIVDGDMGRLDTLLNRLVGKVKDEVAVDVSPAQVIVTLPSNGREAKI